MTAVLATAVVFAIDRVTKILIAGMGALPASPAPGIIALIHHQNYGIIANLPVPQPFIISLTLIVVVLIVLALIAAVRADQAVRILALAVLLGGACGNLYDRLTEGYVFDWILLGGRSVINIADAAIVAGAVLFLLAKKKTVAAYPQGPSD